MGIPNSRGPYLQAGYIVDHAQLVKNNNTGLESRHSMAVSELEIEPDLVSYRPIIMSKILNEYMIITLVSYLR